MIGRLESRLLTYIQPSATNVSNNNYSEKIHTHVNRAISESAKNRSYSEAVHSQHMSDIGYNQNGKHSKVSEISDIGRHLDIMA